MKIIMKIISLVAENIKKLRAVEIVPSGEVVTIAGKNGAGKTSVMDSIWWALAGTTHIQAQQAGQQHAEIEKQRADRQRMQSSANELKQQGMRSREDAARLRAQADECDRQASLSLDTAAKQEHTIDVMPALAQPIDVLALRLQLDQAKDVNASITRRTQRDGLLHEAQALEQQSSSITEEMDARTAEKIEAIKRAKMPIDGLGFGDGCVVYRGVRLEQSSRAEQLHVSLSIAMTANPKLRVIRITDGSLLDDESMAAIADMARQKEYQAWIERVDSSGKVGIVIDDGAVAAVNEVQL